MRKKLKKSERISIWQKCNGKCAYCGCDILIGEMQADHVVPIGVQKNMENDTIDNMLPACRSCNHYKSTFSLEQFRERISKMHSVLMRDSVTYKNAVRFGIVKRIDKPIVFYFETLGLDFGGGFGA